ncbi:MAG: hypothetical protein MUD06_03175 [Rhodospirillales bacterium]|jgi:hypothetical protein|nr:hypothetical protein [Rhodospirillales bacterium]
MKCTRTRAAVVLAAGLLAASGALAEPAPALGGATGQAWTAMAGDDLAGHAGGSRGVELGAVLDDLQLNASNTTATMTGNTIAGFASGAALGNAMSDIHGFGNTMVVNTGVLTMSNSVNVNVSVDMSR